MHPPSPSLYALHALFSGFVGGCLGHALINVESMPYKPGIDFSPG